MDLTENEPCVFLDENDRSSHPGTILGQYGRDFAWAYVDDMKTVFEFAPHADLVFRREGVLHFFDYEMKRALKDAAGGKTPILWHCRDDALRTRMLNVLRLRALLLGEAWA